MAQSTSGNARDANNLNPGPPPRPKRKLGCKTLLYAFLILLGLLGCSIAFLLLRGAVDTFRHPHSRLYQDLNVPYRTQDVVRPLVDGNQTFDIIATVWLRTELPVTDTPENDEGSHRRLEKGLSLHEKAIFSDTVFRGLRLKDKKKKTSVNLQIPTEIFKRRDLNNYDLRASFVLVPTFPSLLENATAYSNWRPPSALYPPVRSWSHDYKPSIVEEIVDSYGTFMPLIAFHNIQSKCADDEDDANADEDEVEEKNDVLPLQADSQNNKWISVADRPVLKAHPYIITRSFLRVADMTKIFNRKAYDEMHNKLKQTSCRRDVKTSWKACVRNFHTTGNQEVKIKLTRKSQKTGKERTEWAYAPHLSLSRSAWGPLDLVPVPVNRENCPPSLIETSMADETSINITWTIAFAGRTPVKLLAAEALGQPGIEYNMTDTRANLLESQSFVELTESIAGHHLRDDYHVRRQYTLSIVASALLAIEWLLQIHYWYIRSSTVGLSTSGIYLVSMSLLLDSICNATWGAVKNEETSQIDLFVLVVSFIWKFAYVPALLMLRVVTRAEMYWWHRWIPCFRFSLPTHAERASEKINSRVTFRSKAGIFTVLSAFFCIVHSQEYFIIDPRGPNVPTKNKVQKFIHLALNCTVFPAMTLGWTLQIILNYRKKTFAGSYAIAAYIAFLWQVLGLIAQSPRFVGETTLGTPFKFNNLFELFCWTALAFQAFMYPSVSESEVDEEDETR